MFCYMIQQCNHSLAEARIIGDLIEEVHGIVAKASIRKKGASALVFATAKLIPVEDLAALGLSGPVNDAEAKRLLTS